MSNGEQTPPKQGVPPQARPPNQRRKWILGLLILVVAAGLVIGIPVYLHYRSTHVTTQDAFIDGHVHYVTSRIPGEIAELLVDDNQEVEAGQILMKLDTGDLETDVLIAQANLASVRNRVAAQIESASAVRAQASSLQAQVSYAEKQKGRATMLVRANAVTKADFDQAYSRWQSLREQMLAADRHVREVMAELGAPGPKGERADVALAEAKAAKAKLELGYATIRAPVRGVVTRRQVEVGQTIAPGQPLFAIVPLDGLYVTANYKETDLTQVRVGQKVTLHVDTYPGVDLHGCVDSIMAGTGAAFSLIPPENATGNFVKVVQRIPVKITFTPSGVDPVLPVLRIGMSVEPTILVGKP